LVIRFSLRECELTKFRHANDSPAHDGGSNATSAAGIDVSSA
jgi:hypothetical protein